MKLTREAARANLRTLALEMISLKRNGNGYRALRFSDEDRDRYHESLAILDAELSAVDRVLHEMALMQAKIGELLYAWEKK